MRHAHLAQLLVALLPLSALADEGCHVTAVDSGSSLNCRSSDGRDLRIELRGIDIPTVIAETAHQRLEALVGTHSVTLRQPQTRAPGQISAAVWATPPDCPSCGHTLDVGRALLSVGLARWKPDAAQGEEERAQYSFEEQEARARKIGLWGKSPDARP